MKYANTIVIAVVTTFFASAAVAYWTNWFNGKPSLSDKQKQFFQQKK